MKYYIKDDTIYIKYISALDGKLKTLEFNVNDDKDFLKNLFKEKKEENQIFMLDDTLREKEHPTNEDMEYVSIMKLSKPKKDEDKYQKYQFYKVKYDEEDKILNELTDKMKEPGITPDELKQLKETFRTEEKKKEYYKSEMDKNLKLVNEIIKPKKEEIKLLEEILNKKNEDSDENIIKLIKDTMRSEGYSDAEIEDIFKPGVSANTIIKNYIKTEKGKKEITKKLKKYFETFQDRTLAGYKKRYLELFSSKNIDDIETKEDLLQLENEFKEYRHDFPSNSDSYYVCVYTDPSMTIETKGGAKPRTYGDFSPLRNTDKFYYLYTSLTPTDISQQKKTKGASNVFLDLNQLYVPYNQKKKFFQEMEKSLKEFMKQKKDIIESGYGLKSKIKKSMTSDIDKKLDTLIQNFETLKNDYINFKEEIKTKSKIGEEPKKEIEIIKNETIKEEPKEEKRQENNFLDMIKNFSKNKLRHQEIIKQEPKEEKSKLEETFEKRRKDIEMSDDEEEDDLEWLD